jgi:hypothetical protein
MLVVPPAFQAGLRDWIKISLSRCVAIFACRWCDECAHVAYRSGQVVLARNWSEVIFKYDLERGDVVEFKINAGGAGEELARGHL